MSDESFILVNLKETESKRLAQVISNDTSRKILDYLVNKQDATASDIAKALSLPLSTTQYNLQHLVEAKLLISDEYHYSEKGKEVDHYRLSNKFVIIAPQSSKFESIKEKLMKILPVGILTVATAGIIQLVTGRTGLFTAGSQLESAPSRLLAAAPMAKDAAIDTAAETLSAVSTAPEIIQSYPNIALWFLIGAFSALTIYFLIDLFRKNKKHRYL